MTKNGMRPVHPGEVLKEEYLEPMGLTAAALARALNVSTPTVNDITENPKNISFEELDAAQVARSLPDVDAAIINTNYATDSGLNPKEDALFLDTDNIASVADVYKNIVAARSEDVDNETYKQVVAEYQTSETAALLDDVTEGNDVPAWEQ